MIHWIQWKTKAYVSQCHATGNGTMTLCGKPITLQLILDSPTRSRNGVSEISGV